MKTIILVSGYRQFDLGIFKQDDPRIDIIKTAIRRDLIRFCEEGLSWLVFTGNLGFESWVLEIANEIREEYHFSIASLFCFADQGKYWNDQNKQALEAFKKVDFVKHCFETYENIDQLKNYQQFLIDSTDGAYLFYDEEHKTSLKYFYQMMSDADHIVRQLRFDDLNDIAIENK